MRPNSLPDRLLSVLFPKTCILCGTTVEYSDFICTECEAPYVEKPVILNPLYRNVMHQANAAFYYENTARAAMLRLKRDQKPDLRTIFFFADEMWRKLQNSAPHQKTDVITAVPQSSLQQNQRNHNPAVLLADRLSELSGIPRRHDLLIRSDDSRIQHSLNQQERLQNALASYRASGLVQLAGKSILLVDDIYTTGATCFACAGQLIENGATKVSVLTALYAPKYESDEN